MLVLYPAFFMTYILYNNKKFVKVNEFGNGWWLFSLRALM